MTDMTAMRSADVPVIAEVDVCVVGAGSAGSTAAFAAARGGARTSPNWGRSRARSS